MTGRSASERLSVCTQDVILSLSKDEVHPRRTKGNT